MQYIHISNNYVVQLKQHYMLITYQFLEDSYLKLKLKARIKMSNFQIIRRTYIQTTEESWLRLMVVLVTMSWLWYFTSAWKHYHWGRWGQGYMGFLWIISSACESTVISIAMKLQWKVHIPLPAFTFYPQDCTSIYVFPCYTKDDVIRT